MKSYQKNAFSDFCQKFPQAMHEVEIFFCQFPNPWTLRVSGMGCYTSKCEKSQNHCTLMRSPLVIYIYDFATAPFWISLYVRKIWFSFLSVCASYTDENILKYRLVWVCRTQGDDRTPPLPISSDFFSTFLDVSDSDPRSLMKVW